MPPIRNSVSCLLSEIPDPVEVEEILSRSRGISPSLQILHGFPTDDISVLHQARPCRTEQQFLPEQQPDAPSLINLCVRAFTRDFTVLARCYDRCNKLHLDPKETKAATKGLQEQEFEIDKAECSPAAASLASWSSNGSSSTAQAATAEQRNSWVISMNDLRNAPDDALVTNMFSPVRPEDADRQNGIARRENRRDRLFPLHTQQSVDRIIELRESAPLPQEQFGRRLLIRCNYFKFIEEELDPIFATLSLYDLAARKKVSESFHFDTNSEEVKGLLAGHIEFQDTSTLSQACIANVSYASPDLFVVIRLEKVLQQGDINDIFDNYCRCEDPKQKEKLRLAAERDCQRLGQYRMPLAWTAFDLAQCIADSEQSSGQQAAAGGGGGTATAAAAPPSAAASLKESAASQLSATLRSKRMDDFLKRGSSQDAYKRASITSEDLERAFDTPRTISVTIKSFFKQEHDKISEEDLFKYLADLRRPSSALKKLKSISAEMRLSLQTCPNEADLDRVLTPELVKVKPFALRDSQLIRELAELPATPLYQTHSTYRNLLYVHPKSVNFSSKQGSARNVAVRTELVHFDGQCANPLPMIYGRSSCPAFSRYHISPVLYHNKSPDFYDEVKVELPGDLGPGHYLLFTFYHISCQQPRKNEPTPIESPIGYSWLPLLRAGTLNAGMYTLMVSADRPPSAFSGIVPEINELTERGLLDKLRWVDHHRELFRVQVGAVTSVHTTDAHLAAFLKASYCVQLGQYCAKAALNEALASLLKADIESLVQHLTPVLDQLFLLIMQQPITNEQNNINDCLAFDALALLVNRIVDAFPDRCDIHGRSTLLTTYIKYAGAVGSGQCGDTQKLVHEVLAQQLILANNRQKAAVTVENAWFFLEAIIRSMQDYLSVEPHLSLARQRRFSEQFNRDLASVCSLLAVCITDPTPSTAPIVVLRANRALAFFISDLLSVMDRLLVLQLLKAYCQSVNARMQSQASQANQLASYKLELLRIVCSHEHFVPLNIPLMEPEIASELSDQFRRSHFLIGLVLAELKLALHNGSSEVQSKAVGIVWNLMASHEADTRYAQLTAAAAVRTRVAQLYLPLLKIAEDVIPLLPAAIRHSKLLQQQQQQQHQQHHHQQQQSDLLPTPATPAEDFARFGFPDQLNSPPQTPFLQRKPLTEETEQQLLLCCAWTVKNVERRAAAAFMRSLSPHRVQQLLKLLIVACCSFEYSGSRRLQPIGKQRSAEVKLKLEEKFLGGRKNSTTVTAAASTTSSTASSSATVIPHSQSETALLSAPQRPQAARWQRKESIAVASVQTTPPPLAPPPAVAPLSLPTNCRDPLLDGNLSLEITLIALDSAELAIATFQGTEALSSHLGLILRLYCSCLSLNQCSAALSCLFASMRSFLTKFPETVFEEESEQCSGLCYQLLRHSGSRLAEVRTQAAATLYLLMRINYTRKFHFSKIKMQLTIAFSLLVGEKHRFNEDQLRRSLKALLSYTDRDEAVAGNFCNQVQDLVQNLHTILCDTIKMREFTEDPEMMVDLMYRVAKGYASSPDLRLTWLQNVTRNHLENNHYAEAAMCLLHSVSLVVEYLHMMDPVQHMPVGCAAFANITRNVLEESAVSDDVISPEEDGVCCSYWFLRPELLALVDHAAQFFEMSGLFEFIEPLYTAVLPLYRHNKDYRKLTAIYAKLHESCYKIAHNEGKRMFGTYFRVGFYGQRFGDLDGEEFVYKEPPLTKLPEIAHRLERFYGDRFGQANLLIIKDSNKVDRSKLDSDKAYVQITYVEPYLEQYELSERQTQFERNNNIKTFVFSTPYTQTGRAHGDLRDQCKRKTVLTTSHTFPYIKTRLTVVDQHSIDMSPMEVALEDLEKKNAELSKALDMYPPDLKILQMVLQGSIGATVNQGPVEIALVFLKSVSEGAEPATNTHHRLRLAFKEFLLKSQEALAKNRDLIAAEQADYQAEMEKNYQIIREQLLPLTNWGNPNFERERRAIVRRRSGSSLSNC